MQFRRPIHDDLASYVKAILLCRRGIFGGIGGRQFIIIESELSSCDFSQLSFTSEYSLTGNGSRSSRSRSSRASSNVSSRLWDFRYKTYLFAKLQYNV